MPDFEVGDNYYEVLDVSQSASSDEIRRAWVKQTKNVHADKTGESEKYEYLLNAGEVLKDDEKRQAYDTLGHALFVDRYGNRGNLKDIHSDDLDPETARKRGEVPGESTAGGNDSGSDSTTSSSTGSSSTSSGRTSSSKSSSKSSTSSGSRSTSSTGSSSRSTSSTGGRTRSTSSSSNKGGRKRRASTSSTQSGTGSQSSTSSSRSRGTGGRQSSRSTRSRTRSSSSGESSSTQTETKSSNESGTEDASIPGRAKNAIQSALFLVTVVPMVGYPVTTRVLSVIFSMVGVWYAATELGYAGTGYDLLAMFVLTAVLLLTIRWLPDFVGASYPKPSSVLSAIPMPLVAVLMLLATGLTAVAEYPILDTMVYSFGITFLFVAVLVMFAIIFAIIGIGLVVLSVLAGDNTDDAGDVIFGSAIIGIVIALLMMLVTVTDPDEALLYEPFELESYLWEPVNLLPEFFLHFPMIATILLAAIVTLGTVGGMLLTVLLLFHDPQRHAHQGWRIRPSLWEIAVTIPLITFIWGMTYESPAETEFLGPYLAQYLVTETGALELIWVPFLALAILFAIRDMVEPRFTNLLE